MFSTRITELYFQIKITMEQISMDSPTYAELKEPSPPRTKTQREMFVPNTTNSNSFGNTYLQKKSQKHGSSARKAKKDKYAANESPAQPPSDSKAYQTNSNSNINSSANIAPVAKGGYNISHVIAANSSHQAISIKPPPVIESVRSKNSTSVVDRNKSKTKQPALPVTGNITSSPLDPNGLLLGKPKDAQQEMFDKTLKAAEQSQKELFDALKDRGPKIQLSIKKSTNEELF